MYAAQPLDQMWSVVNTTTGEVVVSGLTEQDAFQLAYSWNTGFALGCGS